MDNDDLKCPMCHDVLFKPTVLPCGHVYCKSCVASVGEHAGSNVTCKCPLCRRVIPGQGRDLPVCMLLEKFVEQASPARYGERREEEEADQKEVLERDEIPVFVLDPILPKQVILLNIFEPRYKIMLETVMGQGKKAAFGMVGLDERGEPLKVGCEMEILECRPQRNGRYLVEAVGRRVFEVKHHWVVSGYMMAKVKWVGFDDDEACGTEEIEQQIAKWEEEVKSGGWEVSPAHLATVKSQLGPIPTTKTLQALWIAAYINPLPPLGVAEEIRPSVLASATPSSRLLIATEALSRSTAYLHKMSSTYTGRVRRWLHQYSFFNALPIFSLVMAIHYFVHFVQSDEGGEGPQ